MAKIVLVKPGGIASGYYQFYCPGCEYYHGVYTIETKWNKTIWEFDSNLESPTISPSILNTFDDHFCHLFIRKGTIEYLSDSTHHLSGKIVDMVDVPFETEEVE